MIHLDTPMSRSHSNVKVIGQLSRSHDEKMLPKSTVRPRVRAADMILLQGGICQLLESFEWCIFLLTITPRIRQLRGFIVSTAVYGREIHYAIPKLAVEWEQWPGYGYGPDSAVTSANRHSCLTPAKNKERRYRQWWTNCGRYDQSAEDLFIRSLVSVNRNIVGYNKYSYYDSYSFY